VLTAPHGFHRDHGMRMIGRPDHHSIDCLTILSNITR
jgi:hypothetical protein